MKRAGLHGRLHPQVVAGPRSRRGIDPRLCQSSPADLASQTVQPQGKGRGSFPLSGRQFVATIILGFVRRVRYSGICVSTHIRTARSSPSLSKLRRTGSPKSKYSGWSSAGSSFSQDTSSLRAQASVPIFLSVLTSIAYRLARWVVIEAQDHLADGRCSVAPHAECEAGANRSRA